MSADLTPQKAREASDELLTQWANTYRSDSGVHQVVMNEINRRAEVGKHWRKIGVFIVLGLLGLAFWWIKYV